VSAYCGINNLLVAAEIIKIFYEIGNGRTVSPSVLWGLIKGTYEGEQDIVGTFCVCHDVLAVYTYFLWYKQISIQVCSNCWSVAKHVVQIGNSLL